MKNMESKFIEFKSKSMRSLLVNISNISFVRKLNDISTSIYFNAGPDNKIIVDGSFEEIKARIENINKPIN